MSFPSKHCLATDVHSPWVRALHWGSALLVACALATAWLRELWEGEPPARLLLAIHRQLGLAVLLLLAVRLLTRLLLRERTQTASPPWQRMLAAASHAALYLLLAAVPMLGWALTNARGTALRAAGLFGLPALVATDPDRADTLHDWHEDAAWVLLAFVALHAAAALWHHFIARDGILHAMWPGLPRRTFDKTTTEKT
jgi:cytochrome b561